MGRRTYEIFAAYWPYAEGGSYDDIAKTFNRITKYVATRKSVDLTWEGSVALRDAAARSALAVTPVLGREAALQS